MKQRIIGKTLAVAVILLFIGLAIQPSVAVTPETEIDIEPKDYLFQTILDIANNPEVKELLEQYDNDLFKVDIDRSFYRKIFLRNPRLFISILFTKPTLTIEYLNKCYNKGIEITNIIGEDKVVETIDNIGINNRELFDELNVIISKDGELSGRIEVLKKMNKELITDWDFRFLCGIILMLDITLGLILFFVAELSYQNNLPEPLVILFSFICNILYIPIFICYFILVIFDCYYPGP